MPFFVAMNFDAGLQPVAQRLDRRLLYLEVTGQLDKLIHLMPVDRLVQGFPGREVPIQCPDHDAGTPRHRLQARLRAALAEHRLCPALTLANIAVTVVTVASLMTTECFAGRMLIRVRSDRFPSPVLPRPGSSRCVFINGPLAHGLPA